MTKVRLKADDGWQMEDHTQMTYDPMMRTGVRYSRGHELSLTECDSRTELAC